MKTSTQQVDTPIFIGGASSSGNTLLAKMFSRHPHVFCGHEMSLFNKQRIYADFESVKRKLPIWIRRGLPTDGYSQYFKIIPPMENRLFTKEALLRCVSEAGSLRDLLDRIQVHCLSATGKSIFAEKTPSDVYCYRQLAELYPRCLLIHVIRDGRDVACSLMKRGFDIFEAASIWLYNAACGIGCRDLPNYVEIHYENLVKDPQSTLQAICEKASVPFDPCMLRPQEGEQASRFAQAGYWKSCVSDSVNQQSVGRYQADMSSAAYAVFCSVQLTKIGAQKAGTGQLTAFELLRALGYSAELPERQTSSLRIKLLEKRDHLRQNMDLLRRGYWLRPALTQAAVQPADWTRINEINANVNLNLAPGGPQMLARSA